jgi:endonuclease/exonuclease/phosphatase family metal-dependent hydrolase
MGMKRNELARRMVVLGVCLSGATASLLAEQAPIVIDGVFDDWSGVPVAYQDAVGDAGGGGSDLLSIQIADDDRFLFVRLVTGGEFDLSEVNSLVLYLDTDNDDQTGFAINGLGAELEWRFGDRSGTYRSTNGTTSVAHDNIRFRSAPTVTGTTFEFGVGRDAVPDGVVALFGQTSVRVLLVDEGSGDSLPDTGDMVSYTMDLGSLPPDVAIDFARSDPNDVRVAAWNVLNDSPWVPSLQASFGRIMTATAPDIICFQEIRDHTVAETVALVDQWIPAGAGNTWVGSGSESFDTFIISRWPILDSWQLDGNSAALIDTQVVLGQNLLVINVHFPCCGNDFNRQREVDRVMAFIRDSREPGGVVLPLDTPIVIAGDTNFVGFLQQLTTIVTGDIVNEGEFGADFAPDADGTPLTNLIARQTERRLSHTWRNDGSSFWPGQLDYMVYSDSLLTSANHFLVYTPDMSPGNLAANGLQNADSLASDHLLVCADFRAFEGGGGPVPTSSQWGNTALLLLMAVAGTLVFAGRRFPQDA